MIISRLSVSLSFPLPSLPPPLRDPKHRPTFEGIFAQFASINSNALEGAESESESESEREREGGCENESWRERERESGTEREREWARVRGGLGGAQVDPAEWLGGREASARIG